MRKEAMNSSATCSSASITATRSHAHVKSTIRCSPVSLIMKHHFLDFCPLPNSSILPHHPRPSRKLGHLSRRWL
jgi:hypothetical protein